MKILFVMLHPGYVRNYESTIKLLAERGHHVHLCFNQPLKQAEDMLVERVSSCHPNITFTKKQIPKRSHFWRGISRAVNGGIDYLRYFHPLYANAPKLKARLEARLGFVFGRLLKIFLLITHVIGVKILNRFLNIIKKAIPPDEMVTNFIKSHKPDLILVTPLVNIASDQVDIFKSAKSLGLKCGLCVASWDNLTNKGLIRVDPDIVIVWNEIQKAEATELHAVDPSKVVVTGAQCYDKWFEQKPSLLREGFCQRVGFNPDTPFILYLCSSPFITPNEVPFVEKWITGIRNYENPRIRNIGVLVRPHPQNAAQWKDADFSRFENVVIYPREGANPVHEHSKADFHHSLYYCEGVVGINTSAMIEAGILEKPVFTILSPDFKETQEGTVHFHYLVKGGLLHISNNFNEHLKQLGNVLYDDSSYKERIGNFIKDFVRPHGLDMPCTPIVVEAIENLSKSSPLSPKNDSLCIRPYRILLYPMAIIFLVQWIISDIKNKKISPQKALSILKGEIKNKLKKMLRGEKKLIKKSILQFKNFIRPVLLPVAIFIRRRPFMKNYVIPWLINEEIGKVPGSSKIIQIEKEIKNFPESSKPVIIGPWLSEVGFEVLYWIPFLNWAISEHGLDKKRIIVVSRGGAERWYQNISTKYIDIFDYFNQTDFKSKNLKRIAATGGQKHNIVSHFDMEIIQLVKKTMGIQEFDWLHPSLMYNMFKFYWRHKYPISLIEKHTIFKKFQSSFSEKIIKNLPENYVAVKFYFSECFPDTSENRLFISDTIQTLARKSHVVLLSTGLDIDDHKDYETWESDRIHVIKKSMTPRNNLDIQTQIIANSSAFFGTYGGFSYLAPFYGIPSVAFYSREDKFLQVHLDVAYRAFRTLKYGSFDKITKTDNLATTINGRPEFMAVNVNNLNILQMLSKLENSLHDIELQRLK